VQFDSVVTISSAVDVAAVHSSHEARSADGHVLCFERDTESGTVSVHSPGDSAVAVLSPVSAKDVLHTGGEGQPAVDLPACAGSVHMVVELRLAPPGVAVSPSGGGCPGSAVFWLGRRGRFGGGVPTVVQGAAARAAAWPQQVLRGRDSAQHGRMLLNAGNVSSVPAGGAPRPVPPDDPVPESSDADGMAPEPVPASAAPEGTPTSEPFRAPDLLDQLTLMNQPQPAEGMGQLLEDRVAAGQGPAASDPNSERSSSGGPDFTPIIIGIVVGLMIFLVGAVCVIWYRCSQRGRKAQFTVSKRPDGYEYSHAYAPPSSQPPQPPPPPEAHLSVVRPPSPCPPSPAASHSTC